MGSLSDIKHKEHKGHYFITHDQEEVPSNPVRAVLAIKV